LGQARRIEPRQDRLQGHQPRRERIGVVIDRAPDKLRKGGRLIIGKIEHHNSRDMGLGLQDGFQPRHLASRQAVDSLIREHGAGADFEAARLQGPDARTRRRRGAARMGQIRRAIEALQAAPRN
jgi:hypothetical protein